ncbi:PIN domain-containing protein [Polaribacter atrinae]|uniref:PIN domain-containing protein n=1 Tax=Polaribacter atrinae TaxID=1333662 RepID=UPI002492F10D|nr:PIN domain-containing protein [Polaribacter atrinae]
MIRFMAVIDIREIEIKFSDQFFFDTNVWLLIFGTISDYQRRDQAMYSKFLEKIISQDKSIYITSMVVSEFANVLLRFSFKQWKTKADNFSKEFKKDFVGTSEYKSSVEVIKSLINNIFSLPVVIKVPDNFNAVNINNIFNNFDFVDFNDAYIAELSRMNDYKVVTNDKDFKLINSYIDIVTSQI